jgi:hypothetical protein
MVKVIKMVVNNGFEIMLGDKMEKVTNLAGFSSHESLHDLKNDLIQEKLDEIIIKLETGIKVECSNNQCMIRK